MEELLTASILSIHFLHTVLLLFTLLLAVHLLAYLLSEWFLVPFPALLNLRFLRNSIVVCLFLYADDLEIQKGAWP